MPTHSPDKMPLLDNSTKRWIDDLIFMSQTERNKTEALPAPALMGFSAVSCVIFKILV